MPMFHLCGNTASRHACVSPRSNFLNVRIVTISAGSVRSLLIAQDAAVQKLHALSWFVVCQLNLATFEALEFTL